MTGDGDNLNAITAKYAEEAKDKLDNMERFTPTASEVSRRSAEQSRSVSRSIFDDESSHHDDREEREESNRFESFNTLDYTKRSAVNQSLKEFGGPIGTFAYLLIVTIGGFYLQTACTKKSCEFYLPTTKSFTMINQFRMSNIYYYLGYCLWTLILWYLPIGIRISINSTANGNRVYVFNSLFISFTVFVATFVHMGLSNNDHLFVKMYEQYTNYVAIAIVFALVLAIVLHILSTYKKEIDWNPYASSGNVIIDFFFGRHTNFYIFNYVNLKLVCYRIGIILAMLINAFFLYRILIFADFTEEQYKKWTVPEVVAHMYAHVTFDSAALLVTSLTFFYSLDLVYCERHMLNSFELQLEGLGAYALLRYALLPFEVSMISKYVYEHPIKDFPYWAGWVMTVIFLTGLWIKRRSMKLKYEFRMRPTHPKFESKQQMLY